MPLPFAPPLAPMLSKLSDELPPAGDWLYEPKWDGFRALVFRDEDGLQLQSRDERMLARYFPELVASLEPLLPERCVLDGGIVIVGSGGLDFAALLLGLYDDAGVLHHVGVTSSFTAARRAALVEELAPLRDDALAGHPWRDWAELDAEAQQRMPGGTSRWNRGKDLSWEPLRIERVCEVAYDHLQGDRFRHATTFKRWRPDKPPSECRYDQLEETPAAELKQIFAAR